MVAGRPASIAYLRFRVAVPAGATVARATLRLFASSKSHGRLHRAPGGEHDLGRDHDRLRERAADPGPGRGSSGVHRGKAYVSVDVTSLVTRSGLVSLAVKGASARRSASGRASRAPAGRGSSSRPPGRGRGTGDGATGDNGCRWPAAGPAGRVATPPRSVDHVIWIWMENKPYDAVIGSPSAPFENQLAAACGLATNYHGVTHPSLPNYIAATSGSTQGIADDDPPSSHPLDVASIYSQVKAAGKTWRDYAESAPGNCPLTSSGPYAVKHDPAPYYTGIRSDCAAWDVPMGTTASGNFLTDLTSGTLPAFSFVTPDLCNDTHDCPVATGDAWLQSWFAKILASPTYLAGRTVVFVTWDEDDGSASNRVPLIVVSPSTPAGTRSGTSFDHYSLLKTTEQLLGITTFLGHAGDAGTSSMVSAFNLG